MITKENIITALKNVEDPELHIDVWTLGLIYDIDIKEKEVNIKMTFTTPFCPFGPALVEEVEEEIKKTGATKVQVDVVFDPPWKPSEELREMLGV